MQQSFCAFMRQHAVDRFALHVRELKNASTYLASLVLAGVAFFGPSAPVQASHTVPLFGIHCDSVGPEGLAYVPGVNCRLMVVDGYTRRYVVWVPLAGLPSHLPVVFMLHGGSGTGEQFLMHSGWREKATQEGFVAIFPTAVEHFDLEHQRFSTHWNHYGLPHEIDPNRRPAGYPATSPWPADDVTFIHHITDDVRTHLAIDDKRVHVAGFSSGGQMCARLGVELSQLIAAVIHHVVEHHRIGDQVPILDPLFLFDWIATAPPRPTKGNPVRKLMVGFHLRTGQSITVAYCGMAR